MTPDTAAGKALPRRPSGPAVAAMVQWINHQTTLSNASYFEGMRLLDKALIEAEARREPLALLRALRDWFSPDPWEREAPGDGLVTTSEGYRCYACGASTEYIDHSQEGPGWWEKPDHDENAAHNDPCLWVEARAYLAALPEQEVKG